MMWEIVGGACFSGVTANSAAFQCSRPVYSSPFNVGVTCKFLLTNGIQQRWSDVGDCVHVIKPMKL